MEVLRVENQIVRLKESKQWLTDTSIKLNHLIARQADDFEKNRLIKEFKGYLRKKIGLEKLQKEEANRKVAAASSKPALTLDKQDDESFERASLSRDAFGGEIERERGYLMGRERDWLKNDLRPLTRI